MKTEEKNHREKAQQNLSDLEAALNRGNAATRFGDLSEDMGDFRALYFESYGIHEEDGEYTVVFASDGYPVNEEPHRLDGLSLREAVHHVRRLEGFEGAPA